MALKLRLLFASLLTHAALVAGYAQPPDKAKLDQFFDRLAEKDKAMGSLLMAKDGQAVYARAIGYSQINGPEKKPLTAANRFRIGSITKTYTATMILQLVDEGKLKLTDTLDAFHSQVPNAPKITIRQLLNHRSGIPNVRRAPIPQQRVNTLPISKEEILALVVAARPDFEPDAKFAYSNSGFFLLGLILEKATGKSYADALKERITAKLGLADTYIPTGAIDVSKQESLTYFNLAGEWKPSIETHPSILFGAGAIVSTPHDLAKFIFALFEGKLISAESLAAMKTMRDGMGLGLESYTYAGKTFYGHAGGADNYGAWLAYQPEEKLAVAYTTNAKVWPVPNIVTGAIEIYYNKPFEIPTFEAFAVSPEVLDQYVGVYAIAGAPVKFTVTRNGATLHVQPPGESTSTPVEATAENKFRIEGVGVTFEFDAVKKQMTVKRRQGERVFTKEN
jgi:D-alanyl-D-alanine carboxypeptidase